MSWPEDADGDVFRRLDANGIDFSKSYSVDYTVDFSSWPPPQEAIELLRAQYGHVEIYEPEEGDAGYALFQIVGLVSYEGVTSVQRRTSLAMQPYGGVCDAWGVLL